MDPFDVIIGFCQNYVAEIRRAKPEDRGDLLLYNQRVLALEEVVRFCQTMKAFARAELKEEEKARAS